MNKWRIYTIHVSSNIDAPLSVHVWRYHTKVGGEEHKRIVRSYVRPYPSSRARLMRVMSGKPALPETCKWKKGVDCIALFYGECGVRSLEVHNFCPYCGRLIEVIDG